MISIDYCFYFLSSSFLFPLSQYPCTSFLFSVSSYPYLLFRIPSLPFLTGKIYQLFNVCSKFHFLYEALHPAFNDGIISVSGNFLDWVIKWLLFFLTNFTELYIHLSVFPFRIFLYRTKHSKYFCNLLTFRVHCTWFWISLWWQIIVLLSVF